MVLLQVIQCRLFSFCAVIDPLLPLPSLLLYSYLWLATGLKNYFTVVVSVVDICSRTILQSAVSNFSIDFSLSKTTFCKSTSSYSSQFILWHDLRASITWLHHFDFIVLNPKQPTKITGLTPQQGGSHMPEFGTKADMQNHLLVAVTSASTVLKD